MSELPKIKITYTKEFEDSRIEDLICCAIEGGSDYWCVIRAYNTPNGSFPKWRDFEEKSDEVHIDFPHIKLPLMGEGYSLLIGEMESRDYDRVLNREACAKGLELMAQLYPKDFADFLEENEDADTGDVFLQLALYGEVIFG